MLKFNRKNLSRLASVQFLYQNFFVHETCREGRGRAIFLDSSNFLEDFYQTPEILLDEYDNDPNSRVLFSKNYFEKIISHVCQHISEIDSVIYSKCSKKFKQLDPLVSSILRSAVCELIYFDNVPSMVIINEYTNLAHNLLDHYHIGFVNFILDSCSKTYVSQDL